MAEKLFDADYEGASPQLLGCPYAARPCLYDLWPSDQERYFKMAEAALGLKRE